MTPFPNEPQLWFGNAANVRNPRDVLSAGVEAIVDVAADESLPSLPRDLIYLRLPLVDGEGNARERIRLAIDAVIRVREAGLPTLVACSNGSSRSPAITSAAVSIMRNRTPDSVLIDLAGFPLDVSPRFWATVLDVLQGW